MKHTFRIIAATLAVGFGAGGAQAADQVNIICSVQAEWCNMISTVYARTMTLAQASNYAVAHYQETAYALTSAHEAWSAHYRTR